MAFHIAKGIELLNEIPGDGLIAAKDAIVIYNARMFLRKGDELTFDAQSIAAYGDRLNTRIVDGVELIDHATTLGKRQPIAGVEKTLFGMKPGGFREVSVGPTSVLWRTRTCRPHPAKCNASHSTVGT